MIIGVPKEIKADENRVGLLPGGAEQMVAAGHRVLVQAGAGLSSGVGDEDYLHAGARIVDDPAMIYGEADLIIKVKEPLFQEYTLIRSGKWSFVISISQPTELSLKRCRPAKLSQLPMKPYSVPMGAFPS